ncbi:MAG TPA: phasin family protein, partial [Telluria sp.]
MTFPDKLSDAGKQQLATHLDFFQSLTTRMFENAERIVALNIEATRNTLDQASSAARQLAAAKDPRDVLAMGNQSQQQVEAVMAYSRKLLEIANRPAGAATPAATP